MGITESNGIRNKNYFQLNFKLLSIVIFTISVVLLFGISPAYAVGPIVIGGDDLTDHGENTGSLITTGPNAGACDGANIEGWLYIQNAAANILRDELRAGVHDVGILAFGSGPGGDCSDDAGAAIDSAALKAGTTVRHCNGSAAIDACFEDLASGAVNPQMFHMAGTGADNDISGSEGDTINSHAAEIAAYVNSGGGLLAHGDDDDAFGWLSTVLPGFEFGGPCDNDDAVLTPAGVAAFPLITNADIQSGPCHDSFSGNFGGLIVLAFDSDGFPFIVGAAASEEGNIAGISTPDDVYVVMGADGNDDPENGSLATANLDTGTLTQVGGDLANEINEGGGLSGLAIDSLGRFYVTSPDCGQCGDATGLARVNGDGDLIDNVGDTIYFDTVVEASFNVAVRDLSFQPETDVLFGVGRVHEGGPGNALFTIDTSDAAILTVDSIFESGGNIKGIAFDPTDGQLYGVNCSLYKLSLSGAATDEVELERCYDGLGIDSLGQIFATDEGDDSLHLIDPSDGSDVTVAGEGLNPSDVDFIVDNPIAEVHCDTEFHWDFESFPDLGFRFEGEGDESTCTITYADDSEKVVEVSVSGEFGVDPTDFPLVDIFGDFHMEIGEHDGIWIEEEGLVDYSAISETFGDYLIETTGGADSMGIFGDLSECDVETMGEGVGLSSGTATRTIWIICDSPPSIFTSNQGGTSYPDPNLGDPTNRLGAGHDNGFCMNQNCIDVKGFFNHFPETTVAQGST